MLRMLGLSLAVLLSLSSISASRADGKFIKAQQQTMLDCFSKWETALVSSSDPVEYVADAVLQQCNAQVTALVVAGEEDTAQTLKQPTFKFTNTDRARIIESARKSIVTRMVVRRVAAKQIRPSAESESVHQRIEPKTREGKLARCASEQGEWDEYVQEHGNIRLDAIDEHETRMNECKAAAAKLPTAAEFHAAQ